MFRINRADPLAAAVFIAAVATVSTARIAHSETPRPNYASQIMIYDFATQSSRVVHRGDEVWEAPNWSRDRRFLLANSGGKLYRITVDGATFDAGDDDGPDYAPNGRWIYFNSDRGGGWNIWRMPPNGAAPGDLKVQRITNDPLEDWFPHPSPDGKWLLFVSFPAGTEGHDHRDRHIQLRMIPMPGNKFPAVQPQVVTEITGGQGSINVNSWAPDSKRFAYVTYEIANE